ncbi:iron ABC transporter permease [Alloprevotella sp. OH1205_COT-284]|uniref:FecCD family ABC transporter permease n=1 Tax=Alloprevotella sp. OH1205_COT-284 TaxID=2491043 RepID=UPI000F5E7D5C|nr:iron ABC transporter permease [Alloprevotella sp. OH1205_COT-284]RRD79789.1 iron ABC transporter permease [Alloprevotella sp. OH1205_COT-284]
MLRLLLLMLLVLLLAFADLTVGSVSLSWSEVWHALLGRQTDEAVYFIVCRHRLPQMLTALLSGAALGGGGLIMQTLFRNPLADPSLLGVTAGAGLGAAVAILLFGGAVGIGAATLSGFALTMSASFVGAGAALVLLVAAAHRVGGSIRLLIVGVMLSFITSSAISLLNFFATAEGVRSYALWGMGDFSSVGAERIGLYAAAILPPLPAALLFAKPLDTLLLGDDHARSMGIDVRRTRLTLLLIVGWLSAAVTALCGPIAFIGLAAPHMARLLIRTATHRLLLPASLALGGATTLFCLLVSLLPGERGILPLNAITPLVGAPIVLLLILKRR